MNHLLRLLILAELLSLNPAVVFSADLKVSPSPEKYLAEGAQFFKKNSWDEAQEAFLEAVKSPRVEDRIQAYEGLAALYQKLHLKKKEARAIRNLEKEKLFQKKLLPKEESFYESYKVKKGDTYARIASRRRISEEWLMRINGKKLLVENQTILVPKERYALVIDKSAKKLLWKRGNEVLKSYPVSVGREGSETPEGEFLVQEKIKDPVWYRMNQVYPPDSPKNLLGTRWMGLSQKGYGIHGTKNPYSIGSAVSHGCIRMFNHDVEELFSWVPVGTPVLIHTGSSPSAVKTS